MVDVGRRRLPHHREDDEVDEHQRHRQRERPQEPERRSLVLRAQIALEEAREQLAVADQIGVDGHRGIVRGVLARTVSAQPGVRLLRSMPHASAIPQAVNALVAIAAAPIAFFVIRAASAASRARGGSVAEPTQRPLARLARRRRSAGSGSTPASHRRRRRNGRRYRSERSIRRESCSAIVGGCTVDLRVRARSTTSSGLHPVAKLLAPVRRRCDRPRTAGSRVELVRERRRRGGRSAIALARRASRTRSTCSTTWTASRQRSPTVACAYFAIDGRVRRTNSDIVIVLRALARLRLPRLPAVQPPRSGHGAASSWATRGSQLLGFVLACIGLAASWTAAGTTVATVAAALDRPRDPDPRHDARHRSCASSSGGRSPRAARTTPRTASSTTASRSARPSGCSRPSPSRSARRASPTTCSTTAASRRSASSSASSCSSSSATS